MSESQGEPKIEKGIPLPPRKRGKGCKAECSTMEVGDSIFFDTPNQVSQQNKCAQWSRLYSPKKFVSRVVIENGIVGVRIWRSE